MFPKYSRILIVDDVPSQRQVLKGLLLKREYATVEESEDGQMGYNILVGSVKKVVSTAIGGSNGLSVYSP